jgi:hypothetical protein
METNHKVHDEALAASKPAPRMIPDQERRSSVAKAEASATHSFGLESGGQSGRATRGLPPLCTVGAAEFAPPASGRTALFSTAIEFVVFSSPLPDVADPVVVQLVSGFSLEGVVDCAAAGPMINVPMRIAVAARSIFVSMTENRLLNSNLERAIMPMVPLRQGASARRTNLLSAACRWSLTRLQRTSTSLWRWLKTFS